METFRVAHYAPDGELLGTAEFLPEQLSSRWLAVCSNLIEINGGPVFAQSMGGTLQHFAIECAPGFCYFKVSGVTVFHAVLLTGSEGNTPALLAHFGNLVRLPVKSLAPHHYPAALVLDTLSPGVSEQDREAMFQLAYHFAGAYFTWAGA
jgi:hypothetical protein